MSTKKTKTVTNKKYHVSWGRNTTYTRTFDTESKRTFFIEQLTTLEVFNTVFEYNMKTWESEE